MSLYPQAISQLNLKSLKLFRFLSQEINLNQEIIDQFLVISFQENTVFEKLVYKRLIKFVYKIYLLLTEFEVHTVSYGPSFFPLIYGPSAKRAGHKSTGKNEDP